MPLGFSEARPITRQPGHHFFGYYGIPPWNASERLYACLESDFHERPPEPGERATVGVVELASGRFTPLTTTAAWNLQQGAMLHWLPTAPETALIFNDLDEDAGCFRPVILDVPSGARRTMPSPVGIGAVSPDGRSALGLDYARLHTQRPVVGYAGGRDCTLTRPAAWTRRCSPPRWTEATCGASCRGGRRSRTSTGWTRRRQW